VCRLYLVSETAQVELEIGRVEVPASSVLVCHGTSKSSSVFDFSACLFSSSSQGLTHAHFTAKLEDLRETLIPLDLNLSTFGTGPRVTLGYKGDTVSLS